MADAPDKLSKLLKAAREKKGLSQAQVSEAMGWGRGCMYAHLENGVATGRGRHKRVPRREAVEDLSKLLKISYKELAEASVERLTEQKRKLYFGKD